MVVEFLPRLVEQITTGVDCEGDEVQNNQNTGKRLLAKAAMPISTWWPNPSAPLPSHAQISLSDCRQASSSLLYGVIRENRLQVVYAPSQTPFIPIANPWHLLMVGSFQDSVAVDGLSMTNRTVPAVPSQRRHST